MNNAIKFNVNIIVENIVNLSHHDGYTRIFFKSEIKKLRDVVCRS